MKIELRKGRSLFWSIALLAIISTTSVFAQSGRSAIAQQLNCDRPQGDVEVRTCIMNVWTDRLNSAQLN